VYEPTPPQHAAEVLSQLFSLLREAPSEFKSRFRGNDDGTSTSLIKNLKRFGAIPSPRQLHALSLRLPLTLGGAFRVFGYRLDQMRRIDSLINGENTRFVESYPFYRDRKVDLPGVLGTPEVFRRSSLISEVVTNWQRGVPIRAIRGPSWQRQGVVYAQIGTNHTLAMPKVPPGAFVAIEPISRAERQSPDPTKIYFLQHGSGYLCCNCMADRGRLILITSDHSYKGPLDFLYPQRIRIVGRVRSFGVGLPLHPQSGNLEIDDRRFAPLYFPWEHDRFFHLVSAERNRQGKTDFQIARDNEILGVTIGAIISGRTLRRYEHATDAIPHTSILIALALTNSLRFSDALRTLGLWSEDTHRYSLTTLMEAESYFDLPAIPVEAESPSPKEQWEPIFNRWGEWPTLLSMAIPDLGRWGHRMLCINQSEWFKGLDSFVPPHSVVVLEEQKSLSFDNDTRYRRDWDRPLFAFRSDGRIFCGYLETDGSNISLVPHPSSGSPRRVTFRKHQIQVLWRVIGVAVPL
jgi:hypothetical protein